MEPSPLAPGGRRAGATGCRGAATPATDTARAPGRCRHGEAARGLSAFEMNQVTSRRAQLARATRSARNGGPQPERARARGPGSLVGSLRRVKKQRKKGTRPRVSRAGVRGGRARDAWKTAGGRPGARSTACEPRRASSVRDWAGRDTIIIACPLACASVHAWLLPWRHRCYRARVCPPSDAPGRQAGRQTDRFCGSKPVAWCCTTVASCLLRQYDGTGWPVTSRFYPARTHFSSPLFARERSVQNHTVHVCSAFFFFFYMSIRAKS